MLAKLELCLKHGNVKLFFGGVVEICVVSWRATVCTSISHYFQGCDYQVARPKQPSSSSPTPHRKSTGQVHVARMCRDHAATRNRTLHTRLTKTSRPSPNTEPSGRAGQPRPCASSAAREALARAPALAKPLENPKPPAPHGGRSG